MKINITFRNNECSYTLFASLLLQYTAVAYIKVLYILTCVVNYFDIYRVKMLVQN